VWRQFTQRNNSIQHFSSIPTGIKSSEIQTSLGVLPFAGGLHHKKRKEEGHIPDGPPPLLVQSFNLLLVWQKMQVLKIESEEKLLDERDGWGRR
jgi:hypothetical protein